MNLKEEWCYAKLSVLIKVAELLYPTGDEFDQYPSIGQNEKVQELKDRIHTTVWCKFSWLDRLRLLASGRLIVSTVTGTEFEVGKTLVGHKVSVLPPEFMSDRGTVVCEDVFTARL